MRFIGLILFMIFAAFPAYAEIAVASGGRVTLTTTGSFDQVCHSLGRVSVGLIEQPSNGTVLVDHINDYPNFSAYNTRSRCNTRRLPETRISYQSNPGYIGTDETIIELVFPDGRVGRYRYYISVRQGIAGQPYQAVRRAR